MPRRTSWKIVAIVVGVALTALAGLTLFVAAALGDDGKAQDVQVVRCETSGGTAEVDVEVTNSSDSRRAYAIVVDVMWIDQIMGTGVVWVADIAPGQTVRQSGTFPVRGGGDECVIKSVE